MTYVTASKRRSRFHPPPWGEVAGGGNAFALLEGAEAALSRDSH